ncbi:MAG: GspE/PulE family protein [Patescibacteria group bacterium]
MLPSDIPVLESFSAQDVSGKDSRTIPSSAIGIIDTLLAEAIDRGASDIHLIPQRAGVRVRMRIDGLLEDVHSLPQSIHPSLLARIKILAGLRTDEHFAAQDGRFVFRTLSAESDIRVSIVPTYHGENAVLRVLTTSQDSLTLKNLGCKDSHQLLLTRSLERANGMILATGPTGSGKTTLLYALLHLLDTHTRSIVTLEDPIEYSLPGISQVPVNAERGLGFANGLRSVLRQDPDVIMIGEVRDAETARLAANAALTGHLVLSTLHTNDAVSTIPRLVDLGIEPYLIASTLRLIVAQRLVRRICDTCREESEPLERDIERVRMQIGEKVSGSNIFFAGRGCEACRGTGYRGRTGIFEVLSVDDSLRETMLARSNLKDMRGVADASGMLPMMGDGIEKARKGITTIEEIARTAYA